MVTVMRKSLFVLPIVPILLAATPAVAQPAPQLPPQLTDPATTQRLTSTLQVLSTALLNMRVGEVQAALEGRQASPQERNLTVGDLARQKDPEFDRHLQQKMASVGPMVQHSARALNQVLPQVMHDLKNAQKSLERAVANMPDPNYPQR
jgi:hypothetical protein